jgi:hypothetical protein
MPKLEDVVKRIRGSFVFSSSFAGLLEDCNQDWVNLSFVESLWPPEMEPEPSDGWKVKEHIFHEPLTGYDSRSKLSKKIKTGELYLCGPRMAMKYIAGIDPEAQFDHPIVVPIYARHPDGYLVYPVFCRVCRREGSRGLDLRPLGRIFEPFCSWLVYRRQKTAADMPGA